MSSDCNTCSHSGHKCPRPCKCECPPEPIPPINPCGKICQYIPMPIMGPAFYSGEGIPSDTIGRNRDYYLDRTNCVLYQKLDGVWVSLGPLCNTDEDTCAAFVQDTPPTVAEGAVVGSLWVDTATGTLSYFDGTEWIAISDVAAFARTLINLTSGVNELVMDLQNPTIPVDPLSAPHDLSDAIMSYQYAFNTDVTSDQVLFVLSGPDSDFQQLLFRGIPDAGIVAPPVPAATSINAVIELDQLPRILLTFDEFRDGSLFLTRQIAQDVEVPLVQNAVINLRVPFADGGSNIGFQLSWTDATVNSTGPIITSIENIDGNYTLLVNLNIEELSLTNDFSLQKIIEKSTSAEVQIRNIRVEWGFPNATLRLEDAFYKYSATEPVTAALYFLTAPVFVEDPQNLEQVLVLEWDPSVASTGEIDNSGLKSGTGSLPNIVTTTTPPETDGYGIFFDLFYLNVDTSEVQRNGMIKKHSLLTRGEKTNKFSLTKKSPKKHKVNAKKASVVKKLRIK